MPQSHRVYISIYDVLFFSVYFIFVAYMHFSNASQLILVDWSRNDFDYCYLIPLVTIYILFKSRYKILDAVSHPSWIGLFPVILGIVFLFFGELGGEYLIGYISLWLMVLGYFWLQWGAKKLKIALFPFLFLLTMFPPPAYIYSRLTLQMQLLSSAIAELVLYLLGIPVFREGNVIDIGSTKIQVVAACSGLRYLIPMLLVGLLMGYIMRTSHAWRRILLCFLSLPLAIVMNGIRLSSTALLARRYGSWIVEGIYHDVLGWLIFIISISLMFFIMHIIEDNTMATPGDDSNTPSKIRFVYRSDHNFWNSSAIKQLTAIFLIGASVFLLKYTQNVHQVTPNSKSMKSFPTNIGGWEGMRSEISSQVLRELDVTDYILMDYMDSSGKNINFYVAYYASQSKGESIHSPESCMRGAGWRFIETGVRKIDGGIEVNRSLLANQNRQLVSYFWFPCRGRNLTNGMELKLYNFWDSLTRGRTDGALVRVITDSVEGRTQDADERILRFLKDVIPVLNMYLPNK